MIHSFHIVLRNLLRFQFTDMKNSKFPPSELWQVKKNLPENISNNADIFQRGKFIKNLKKSIQHFLLKRKKSMSINKFPKCQLPDSPKNKLNEKKSFQSRINYLFSGQLTSTSFSLLFNLKPTATEIRNSCNENEIKQY